MPNDTQTMIKRRVEPTRKLSALTVPQLPELPEDVVKRFPSMAKWQSDLRTWVDRVNSLLTNVDSSL